MLFIGEPLPLRFRTRIKTAKIMVRILIIFGLITYILYKIGSFFFRAGAAAQELNNLKRKQNQPSPNHIKKSKLDGGEYIDYDEVK